MKVRRTSRDRVGKSDKARQEVDVLSLDKVKAEAECTGLRNKEMRLRRYERRQQSDKERERYRQQDMEKRLGRKGLRREQEQQKLRRMREELERKRMETERLQLETERLQIEREQERYRREQQRVLQDRRPLKRPLEHGSRDHDRPGGKQPADGFQEEGRPQRCNERKTEYFERRDQDGPPICERRREERPPRKERNDEQGKGEQEPEPEPEPKPMEREYSRTEARAAHLKMIALNDPAGLLRISHV